MTILTRSLIILLVSGGMLSAAPTSLQYPATGANYRLFTAEKPPLVPLPRIIDWKDGALGLKSINIAAQIPSGLKYDREQLKFIQSELVGYLKAHEVGISSKSPVKVNLQLMKQFPSGFDEKIKDDALRNEAYQLIVDGKGVTIRAVSTKGLFYGLQTLKQLIVRQNGKTTVALCQIADWPEYQVRGFMNDVGRNYMSLPLIAKELDAMAQMKMNVYHFHFTENEGWRLESKLYPELTNPKYFTRKPGKFYTQKDFQNLVEYCRLRNIQLIPEMDMPGHAKCFRQALGIKNMKDPKATKALTELIKEMCSLVPADKMPYIHIGTDEARGAEEKVDDEILKQYFAAVESCGRTPVRWHPGLSPNGYNGAIQHLWSGRQARGAWPTKGGKYIDSLETYLNHLDPFEVAMTMYFRRPCPFDQAKGLGFMLCSFPDLPIEDERNQVLQTPVYSGIAFVSENLWSNPLGKVTGDPLADDKMKYFSNLPVQGDPLLKGFAEYENRVLAIRDRFFKDKEFNYVRQANIPWKLIGPFPHGGDVDKVFAPEEDILKTGKVAPSYKVDGQEYSWLPETYTGATMIFKHYCDFPTLFNGGKMSAYPDKNKTYYAMTYIYSPKAQTVPFWVSGHTWATSDWRNGPADVPGKWFHTNPKFWVNGKEVDPPQWKKPGNNVGLIDENYHFRTPTMIPLKKGWNPVLIKSPSNNSARRWMFTFVPVLIDEKNPGCNVKEFPGLKFSVNPEK
ncbi:MAG: beta-N-acetylhexosaminidase [Akkermansia sp.]